MMDRKPIVAHVNGTFFLPTETFIYNYLVKFKKTQPVCISREPIKNIHLFPFPQADLYSIHHNEFTPAWLLFGTIKLLASRRLDLEKVLRSREASLIHAHYGPTGHLLCKTKLKLKLPLVTTFYGFDLNPSVKVIGVRDWRARLFEVGDLFLVEGAHMQQRLVELGCPGDKIQIQRIAIPVQDMQWRPRKKVEGRCPVVLFSGRFAEKKGLLYALAAIEELKREGRELEFRIVGDGPMAEQVKRFIDDCAMAGYTHLLGFLEYRNHLREMDNADIFIQPSVTAADGDIEGGAPTTILEAQAMGLPIVSTYHCDIPNSVVPGRSALLVEERNSSALADALRNLLDHPSEWETMGRTGREFVEEYHDIEREVSRLEDKYCNLIQ